MNVARNCTSIASLATFASFAALVAAFVAIAAAPGARAQAVSPLDFGTESLADVRLGVALATVVELVDAPQLLARPSSQGFVDDAFARMLSSTNDPLLRAREPHVRDDLRSDDATHFDRTRADRDLAVLVHDILHALPSPRDRLFATGLLAQQVAYNARVLRSPANDVELRGALAAANVADTLVPGMKDARGRVTAAARGRWGDIAAAASALVAAIAGPNVTPPFPENSGVWLVLLRSRPTTLAARRGTPRLFFDVVRFDGTHHTIGAYPTGDLGFGHDAPALACGFDREGDASSERAVPLEAAPGTTDAQLGDELASRCAANAKGRWHYRVRGATDARFVVDLLVNTVPDGATVLRGIEQ